MLAGLTAAIGAEPDEGTEGEMSVRFSDFLKEEIWDELGAERRLKVIQEVARAEGAELGLPFSVQVCIDDLEEGVLGCYEHKKHRITVDEQRLCRGSAGEVLQTLGHELCHAYQHCLVDLYQENRRYQNLAVFSQANIPTYSDEFDHYQSGSRGDVTAYYTQLVEIEARAFAKYILEKYESFL